MGLGLRCRAGLPALGVFTLLVLAAGCSSTRAPDAPAAETRPAPEAAALRPASSEVPAPNLSMGGHTGVPQPALRRPDTPYTELWRQAAENRSAPPPSGSEPWEPPRDPDAPTLQPGGQPEGTFVSAANIRAALAPRAAAPETPPAADNSAPAASYSLLASGNAPPDRPALGEEGPASPPANGPAAFVPPDAHLLEPYLHGIASWYGPSFQGRPTANGEIYNQYGMTAAHPLLPIGTKVQVENLSNGRKVWLRINDRGPYAKGRVLDLSRIAAEQLGMIRQGTAPVRITVLHWPESVLAAGLKPFTQYLVQVAAYPDPAEAEQLRARLQRQFGQAAFMIEPAANGFHAVAAGPYDAETDARQLAYDLSLSGYGSLVRRYRN